MLLTPQEQTPYLCLFGFSFHNTSIEVRELLSIPEKEIDTILHFLLSHPFILEAFIISTCNRLEISLVVSISDNIEQAVEELFLNIKPNFPRSFLNQHYFYLQEDACRHLIKVAAGLDSMILGEPQIFGQIKQGYEIGKQNKSIKTHLSKYLDIVIKAAKRIRTETDIAKGSIGIPSAAIELSTKTFKNLKNKKVLLIGAGKMGSITAKHFEKKEVSDLYITNRSIEKAVLLAETLKATIIPWKNFKNHLQDVDIIISSTASDTYILSQEDIPKRIHPLIIIDISLPRNIDPSINSIENIFLYDIDSLKQINEESEKQRRNEIPKALDIIEEEVASFITWVHTLKVRNIIKELKTSINVSIESELKKNELFFTPEQLIQIKASFESLADKFLKNPIIKLNQFAQHGEEGILKIDTLKEIFNLK